LLQREGHTPSFAKEEVEEEVEEEELEDEVEDEVEKGEGGRATADKDGCRRMRVQRASD
jgi:hypothetical protein